MSGPYLYITADEIGTETGGGQVTYYESRALAELGPCEVWDRRAIIKDGQTHNDPWGWDDVAWTKRDFVVNPPKLAHVYAGTFTKTVEQLQKNGAKVTYTAAAHDVTASRREHERAGLPFAYPHLTDPEQWQRYVRGYLRADVLIVPSEHSAAVMRAFGATNRIVVIPHGVRVPDGEPVPLPRAFVIGYLGAYGPDKGVRYLLEAFAALDDPTALLVLGGRDSTHPYVSGLVRQFAPRAAVEQAGWFPSVSDFYNRLACYVQPSVTEGFGCEVTEAMAHGRPVLCSTGAGAVDHVPESCRFAPADVESLVVGLRKMRNYHREWTPSTAYWRNRVAALTWDKIRARYVALWREVLS